MPFCEKPAASEHSAWKTKPTLKSVPLPIKSDNRPQGRYSDAVASAYTRAIQPARVKSALNSTMMTGSAMLICPASAVTVKIAKATTHNDHQRRCGDKELWAAVMNGNGRGGC